MNFRLLRGKSGSTLPVVLAFASVGLIVVMAYLSHQVRSNTGALRSPAALQAILNARSGIYRALENPDSGNGANPPETASAVDRLFHMDMFGDADAHSDSEPSGADINKKIFLYTNDSANTADINVATQGIYSLITSVSTVLNTTRTAEARLGSPAPAKPDTVLILENELPVRGRFRGTVHQTAKIQDTVPSSKSAAERAKDFFFGLNLKNVSVEDTAFFNVPLVIRNAGELAAIPDTVNGHLLLDGAFSSITWKDRRKIAVLGDLQITGFFNLENLEFSVGGEIKILGNAALVNVSVSSTQRIFIGDNAVFQGSALATGSINVYGNAEVRKQSSLISMGAQSSAPQRRDRPNRYSIFFSESAKFDGAAIALGNPGGIKTGPRTKLHGVLWAQKAVCHRGQLSGIIKAELLLDCFDPKSDSLAATPNIAENTFSGTIEPLLSIGDYVMPYFIGTPRIIGWREF